MPESSPGVAAPPIPFGRATVSEDGLDAVRDAVLTGQTKAGGVYTRRCEELLRARLGAPAVLMLNSCTAGLELAAMLLDLGPGDEVIMPSFGYASSANAVALRGAVPVFVDITPGTLNLDPTHLDRAITSRTRAVLPVHYAGVAADMDAINAIAREHRLAVVEDAAQGIGATFRGRSLGTLGDLGVISFDATKNLGSGAGGALIINDRALAERAEWLRDCGTDRAGFARGTVDRYRWVDIGTNAAMNELAAAYLYPQLRDETVVTGARRAAWQRYNDGLAGAERRGHLSRPVVPTGCAHNAHNFFVVTSTEEHRDALIAGLAEVGISATFHFVPLHSAPAGRRAGRVAGPLVNTDALSVRLVRLPIWNDMRPAEVDRVVEAVEEIMASIHEAAR